MLIVIVCCATASGTLLAHRAIERGASCTGGKCPPLVAVKVDPGIGGVGVSPGGIGGGGGSLFSPGDVVS
jgi:hypothetical protein